MPRMTAKTYAARCGVKKRTVYAWVKNGQLPEGAQVTRTATDRLIIHVDEDKHPPMPLYTET
jgi:predicted site-specific integrase-resolvase